jgi:predicted glycoside hydrolase/deacetylase ChbG (UPF0249 family)
MDRIAILGLFSMAVLGAVQAGAQQPPTYAERLGWPAGARVVIFHVDDAGMSHESNVGVIESMTQGVANSASIMMPCAWVSEYVRHLAKNPDTDAGLHLTLTSEWDGYRWPPVAGRTFVPTATDPQGCLWDSAELVAQNATADDVEREIRAQIDRAEVMGIKYTHLDSHMGTLFNPKFFERYLKIGIEKKTPILIAGGHLTHIQRENADVMEPIRAAADLAWNAGLPVIDDIHTDAYGAAEFDAKKAMLLDVIRNLKPGITEIILHCTKTGNTFAAISTSGPTREADLKCMLDADIKKALQDEKIELTTWRELMDRRQKAK